MRTILKLIAVAMFVLGMFWWVEVSRSIRNPVPSDKPAFERQPWVRMR